MGQLVGIDLGSPNSPEHSIIGAMKIVQFLKRHCGAVILFGVVSYSLFYAVAFVRLYFVQHPYDISSRWILDHVPAGSRIVSPHWDDKVPRSIPDYPRSPSVYKMEGREFELGVYEQDTSPNLQLLLRKISSADYITFATPRAVDSIPRIPLEYPRTTALLQLLWAEKLGFKLEKTFKNRPSLVGFEFNDDLADESFSVYDHPKVVVFKNVEHLLPEEMMIRIQSAAESGPLPSMDEMLLMDQGGWAPSKRLWNPEWNGYVRLISLLVALGVIGAILRGCRCARLPDGGLGFAGGVGLLGLFGVCWGSAWLGLLPFSEAAARYVVGVLGLVALSRLVLRADVRKNFFNIVAAHGVWVVAATFGGAVVVAGIRWQDTNFFELQGGAQAAYMRYCMRVSDVPFRDVFRPGEGLPWSHVGTCIVSLGLRAAAVPSELAFKAAPLLFGGIVGSLLYSVLVGLSRVPARALVGALLLVVPFAYVQKALNEAAPASSSFAAPSAGSEAFVKWLDQNIAAAPVVLESCDDPGARGVAARAGLPTFAEPAGSLKPDSGVTLCSALDPKEAYDGMMRYELPLFVTQGTSHAATAGVVTRLSNFDARPDLFSKIYDDGGVVVYAPAFSPYFKAPQAG